MITTYLPKRKQSVILAALAVIFYGSSVFAAIIVDGQGPDESNNRPGIQNTNGTWTDPNGVVRPDPPDSCVNPAHPRYKRFRTLQSALYALNQGLVADSVIRIAVSALNGAESGLPSGVPSNIIIAKPVQIERGAITARPVINGGNSVITIQSLGVTLVGLEIRNGSGNGILIYSDAGGLTTSGIELRDCIIHNNSTGIYVTASNSAPRVRLDRCDVRDNQNHGIYVDASRTTLSVGGTAATRAFVRNNRNGYGVYVKGTGPGTGGATAQLDTLYADILNNGYDGLHAETGVRFLMEDSRVEDNAWRGVYVEATPPFQPLASPTMRRSIVRNNRMGGIVLKDITRFNADFTRMEIKENTPFGLTLDNAGAELRVSCDISLNKRDMTVSPNLLSGYGIYARNRSQLTLTDSLVRDNEDTGIILQQSSGATLTNVTVTHNARHGISLRQSTVNITGRVKINDNTQAGISAYDRSHVVIAANTQIGFQGQSGIYADNSTVSVNGTTFTRNPWRAITVTNGADLKVKGSVFTNNCMDPNPDGVINVLDNATAVIGPDNTIENNQATGIQVHNAPGTVIIEKNTIRGNVADSNGGGILVWDSQRSATGTNPEIRMNKIIGNTAYGSGGGISIIDARAIIKPDPASNEKILIQSNKTNGSGAGISVINPAGVIRIERTMIDDNEATTTNPNLARGGGIQVYADPGLPISTANRVIITNDNHIINNQALRGGGIGVINALVHIGSESGSSGNIIQSNVARTTEALGRYPAWGIGGGIYLSNPVTANGNTVQGNLISKNNGSQIYITSGGGHIIRENNIGVGGTQAQNRGHGIVINDAGENTIGGTAAADANTIVENAACGIVVHQGQRNAMLSNAIYNNGELGIDLGSDGISHNQDTSPAGGANQRQNVPLLLFSNAAGGKGVLHSIPSHTFTIQFFLNSAKDDSGFGEGETFHSSISVTTDADGKAEFTLPVVPGGQFLSATATDANKNTSEFSCGLHTRLPLGGSIAASEPGCYRVYVPSRWGGTLNITTTAGAIHSLKGPDGKTFANNTETGIGKHGWYTFHVDSAAPYTLATTFTEQAQAATVPWNFWYFPYSTAKSGLHLFDVPGAYTKYDTHFSLGTVSFDWEVAPANGHKKTPPGVEDWEGHCWGIAIASIILAQPAATAGFTQDELEGLAGEFFDRFGSAPLATFPFEKPTAADTDGGDSLVHQFHNGFREMLKTKNKAFHMNLRQSTGTGSAEVWNQGCYRYHSEVREDPAAAGDADTQKIYQIKFKTTFTCNDDFLSAGVSIGDPVSSPTRKREQESEYILIFAPDGLIRPAGAIAGRNQNWLTMKLVHTASGPVTPPRNIFIPGRMRDVTPIGARYTAATVETGKNPNVKSDRLRTLGLTKNPGF